MTDIDLRHKPGLDMICIKCSQYVPLNQNEQTLCFISEYIDKPINVKIEKIHPNAKIPTKGTELRAYYDVYSVEDAELKPEEVCMVHTGLKVQPPKGYFIDIRPRSGLGKEGVTINNAPGTLDCDYGGELIVELIWHHPKIEDIKEYHYNIHKGDRIAQINVMPMYEIEFVETRVEGTKGFGSTGR